MADLLLVRLVLRFAAAAVSVQEIRRALTVLSRDFPERPLSESAPDFVFVVARPGKMVATADAALAGRIVPWIQMSS